MKAYLIKSKLESSHERRNVARTVIERILSPCPERHISSVEYTLLATQICSLFLEEAKASWYSPYKPPTDVSPKMVASGLLYEAGRRLRQKTLKNQGNEVVNKRRRRSSVQMTSDEDSAAHGVTKDVFSEVGKS